MTTYSTHESISECNSSLKSNLLGKSERTVSLRRFSFCEELFAISQKRLYSVHDAL